MYIGTGSCRNQFPCTLLSGPAAGRFAVARAGENAVSKYSQITHARYSIDTLVMHSLQTMQWQGRGLGVGTGESEITKQKIIVAVNIVVDLRALSEERRILTNNTTYIPL